MSAASSTSILSASKNGVTDCVKRLLESSDGANARDSSGKTALMLAAENGHADILRLLLTAGYNVRACQPRTNRTALHFASESTREACVSALLEAGANVNSLDSDDNTPLLLATKKYNKYCNSASFQIMKHLIDAGTNLDQQDKNKRTALHYACYRAVGTELLLSSGASPNLRDEEGNTPLHISSIEGFDSIVRCLTTFNCDPNVINDDGRMGVHYLAMKGHWEGIEDIARVGGYLDHLDRDRLAPLCYAVKYRRTLAVQALLRANCSADPQCSRTHGLSNGSTVCEEDDEALTKLAPLVIALTNHYYHIVQQLVLAGCALGPLRTAVAEYNARVAASEEERRNESLLVQLSRAGQVDEVDVVERDAMKWFSEWLLGPPSLKQISRVRIRDCVRKVSMERTLKDLEAQLPLALREYISLRELEDLEDFDQNRSRSQ